MTNWKRGKYAIPNDAHHNLSGLPGWFSVYIPRLLQHFGVLKQITLSKLNLGTTPCNRAWSSAVLRRLSYGKPSIAPESRAQVTSEMLSNPLQLLTNCMWKLYQLPEEYLHARVWPLPEWRQQKKNEKSCKLNTVPPCPTQNRTVFNCCWACRFQKGLWNCYIVDQPNWHFRLLKMVVEALGNKKFCVLAV